MNERAHQLVGSRTYDQTGRLMSYRDQLAPGDCCAFNRVAVPRPDTLMTDFEIEVDAAPGEPCGCGSRQSSASQLQQDYDLERWSRYLEVVTLNSLQR